MASALANTMQGLSLSAKPTAASAPAASRIASFSGFKKVEGQSASLILQPRSVKLSASTRQVVRAAVVAEPATLDVKDTKGASTGSETLQLKVADASAKGLVHRYLVLVRQNARQGNASTKTRSEVRGGGKKPYGQKGTGNARRGSQRTPLRPGGGIIFGPKPRDWTIKMNKKERRLAMATALQSAVDDMIVVEDLAGAFPDMKTKSMAQAMKAWGVDGKEHALLITKDALAEVDRVGGNLPNLTINNLGHGLSVYDVLRADKLIVEKSALAQLNDFYGAN